MVDENEGEGLTLSADVAAPALVGAASATAGVLVGALATPVLGPAGGAIIGGAVENVVQHVLTHPDAALANPDTLSLSEPSTPFAGPVDRHIPGFELTTSIGASDDQAAFSEQDALQTNIDG